MSIVNFFQIDGAKIQKYSYTAPERKKHYLCGLKTYDYGIHVF